MRFAPAPSVAVLELTLRCPCRCQTCGSHAGGARPRELSHQNWLAVISGLADLGCRRVTLMGGEPLLYPRWVELVQAAGSRDLLVDLVSCGLGLDEGVAKAMRESGLHAVTISIDGLGPSHDTQRGLPGCFDQALSAIRCADRAGLKVGVNTQVNPSNLAELKMLAPVLEEAGVLGWQWQMTLPLGRAQEHPDLICSPAMMPELLATLRALQSRQGLRPHLTDNLGYGTPDDTRLRTIQGGFPSPWMGCRAGLEAVGVTSDGRVKGCLALPDSCSEGSLLDEPLAAIWNDPNRFRYNRCYRPEQLAGDCAKCRLAARCRGGCSATAYAMQGRPGISTHCFRLLPGEEC